MDFGISRYIKDLSSLSEIERVAAIITHNCQKPFKNYTTERMIFHILQEERKMPFENMPIIYNEIYKRCWVYDLTRLLEASVIL
ncbi:hypothetical protein C2G38_2180558 [Gigaspora rosea]|uniref:Uncharacterized protein n=1 Tax=Gigaspora rosea TaxID=44941 RepID=A0A397VBS8_9GLOM|nr:hypothetical protein C2G38_2180558 [Gigaspora rosea]